MEAISPVLDVVTTCLNIISIIILVWGVVLSVKDFLLAHMRHEGKAARLRKLQETKNGLGGYVLLSLEILIVADIIETIVKPTLEDIIRLAAIVAIRTVISYFLNREIQESDRMKIKQNQ